MAGELYVSNLVGSFDYQEILNLYYQSKIAPIQLLKQQELKIEEKTSALRDLESRLNNLKEAFDNLVSNNLLDQKTVSVSDPDLIKVEVLDPSKAIEGLYQITVKQLAQNDVWLSQSGVQDLDTAVSTGEGQLEIRYEGEVVAVVDYDADASDSSKPSTLSEIVNAINNSQDKVKASVIFDGDNYRLLLSGTATGDDADVSISETGDGDLLDKLELGDNYSDSHVQVAQDAKLEIYGTVISSSSNTFVDAIPGLKLDASEVGSTTIEVSKDFQSLKDALNSFIEAYNSIVDFLQDKAGKDGVLSGDNTVYLVRSSLLSRFQPLFNLGILDVDKDTGHLNVDSPKLNNLLENSPQEIKDAIGQLKTSLQDYLLFLTSPESPVENELDNLNRQKNRIEDRIYDLDSMLKEQVELFRKQLVQLQLLQAQMEELRAKIASTFGVTSILSNSKGE